MLQGIRTRVLPWVVWVGTMGAVTLLWQDVHDEATIGFAIGTEVEVAPVEAGRVTAVTVAPGQRVRAGQVVATLDARVLDAEQAILAAERTRLEAELGAVRSEATLRVGDTTREFDESIAAAERALRSARADRTVRAAALKAMTSQIEALRGLVDRRMADRRELDALAVQHATLQEELQKAEGLVQQLTGQAAAARARRAGLPQGATEQALGPIHAELAVLAGREALLASRRDRTVLRAPADGEVARVHRHAGEFVAAGEAVATIVGPGLAGEVQVCAREGVAAAVQPGEAVRLRPRGAGESALAGHVTRAGPRVTELPLRCRRDPAIPEWGREVVVALDTPGALLPGQAFAVTFLGHASNHASPPAPSRADAPEPAPPREAVVAAPAPLAVPPELRAQTRFEPSGLTWSPARARYVVVSDDTGLETQGEHAPWLFTMDARGRVDREPLVVAGIEAWSDLEAISPGPEDSLYVIASQGRSRKGKRPAARQVFARVALDGAGARVVAQIRFAERLADAGPELRAALGLERADNFEIEGMTATAAGGLLLGLKEPQDGGGQAIVWHLPRPDALLTGATIEAAGLRRHGGAALRVAADGGERAGGIAELLELPDGALLIAATVSGDEPARQDGGLWYAGHRDTLDAVRLIRSFPGLKPEGLALRPDGAAVVVVFDTGAEPPQWMELPWPASAGP